jgi:hypothetical protein
LLFSNKFWHTIATLQFKTFSFARRQNFFLILTVTYLSRLFHWHEAVANISLILLLRLLGVARSGFSFAQGADRCVAVNLLVTRQASLHRRWLLPNKKKKTEAIDYYLTRTFNLK